MSGLPFRQTVELSGHIIDSLILPKVFDIIVEAGADYEVVDFSIGKTNKDASRAKIMIMAATASELADLLAELQPHGALPPEETDVHLETCPADGVFPEGFYCTTNLETRVRVAGRWLEVHPTEMDLGIVVEEGRARATPMAEVLAGEMAVIGHAGVSVRPLERPRRGGVFEFMSSAVSPEKPKALEVAMVAREMKAVKGRGEKILFVLGPAVVHTGAGPDLCRIVEAGFCDTVFAGNALAVHDVEAQFFGTSLGIDLTGGTAADRGHEHHLRSINRIRACGGLRAAVEQGILTGGIMWTLIRGGHDFVLAGSIRDDGPLPEVITDSVEAQKAMRGKLSGVGMCLMIATTLHAVATGNLLPAGIRTICVDINPAVVTKLADRGSFQAKGLVTDVGLFLRELADELDREGGPR